MKEVKYLFIKIKTFIIVLVTMLFIKKYTHLAIQKKLNISYFFSLFSEYQFEYILLIYWKNDFFLNLLSILLWNNNAILLELDFKTNIMDVLTIILYVLTRQRQESFLEKHIQNYCVNHVTLYYAFYPYTTTIKNSRLVTHQ